MFIHDELTRRECGLLLYFTCFHSMLLLFLLVLYLICKTNGLNCHHSCTSSIFICFPPSTSVSSFLFLFCFLIIFPSFPLCTCWQAPFLVTWQWLWLMESLSSHTYIHTAAFWLHFSALLVLPNCHLQPPPYCSLPYFVWWHQKQAWQDRKGQDTKHRGHNTAAFLARSQPTQNTATCHYPQPLPSLNAPL